MGIKCVRYPLTLPYIYFSENLHYANLKADEIKLDIRKGCFDTTLEKYKPPKPVKPAPVIKAVAKEEPKPVFLNNLVEKFNYWGNHIRNIDVENSIDYLYTRKLLEKWANVPIHQIAINEDWKYIHMLPDDLLKALKDLQPKKLVTVHNSKYALARHSWKEPLEKIALAAQRDSINLLTPKIGETLFLVGNNNQKFTRWWSGLK